VCGILGVAVSSGVEGWEARVEMALDAVEHRGPDARAQKTIEGSGSACVLGHTRLRIVDLSPAADQPMPNEDGSVWMWPGANGFRW
jgi:asparagine synthase (glutamine-hydrolysing)